jgi:hypothetical protein
VIVRPIESLPINNCHQLVMGGVFRMGVESWKGVP